MQPVQSVSQDQQQQQQQQQQVTPGQIKPEMPEMMPRMDEHLLASAARPPSTGELTTAMGIPSKGRIRRVWTPEEDEKLRLLVSYWGDQCGKNGHWDKISSHFVNRTSKDCRKRWFHSLDPKLKRGRWTEHEDKVLIEAYKKMGPVWHRIAQLIPGRTDDQCSKRYNDVLDPNISNRLRSWSQEEDQLLLRLVKKHGTKWRHIAKEMDGRTGLTCRNRWRKLVSPSVTRDQNPATQTPPTSAQAIQNPQNGPPQLVPQQNPVPLPQQQQQQQPQTHQQTQQQQRQQQPQALQVHAQSQPQPPLGQDPNLTRSQPSRSNSPRASSPSSSEDSINNNTNLTNSTTTQTHYTYTVGSETKHVPLTTGELKDLVDVLTKSGQQITLHQHNYHHHHYYGSANGANGTNGTHGTNSSSGANGVANGPPNTSVLASQSRDMSLGPSHSNTGGTSTNNATPGPGMSTAGTPSGFLAGMDLIGVEDDVLAEFDEDLALDFESFDGIPFNPS